MKLFAVVINNKNADLFMRTRFELFKHIAPFLNDLMDQKCDKLLVRRVFVLLKECSAEIVALDRALKIPDDGSNKQMEDWCEKMFNYIKDEYKDLNDLENINEQNTNNDQQA